VKPPKSKQQLVGAIHERLFPQLAALGFSKVGSTDQMQARGYVFQRIRGEHKDEVRFWWDKYGRASFLLQFITTDGTLMNALPTAYSAPRPQVHAAALSAKHSMRSLLAGGPKWFHVSRLARLGSPVRAAGSVVEEASERLAEIDAFFKNGTVSRYFQH